MEVLKLCAVDLKVPADGGTLSHKPIPLLRGFRARPGPLNTPSLSDIAATAEATQRPMPYQKL